MNNEKCKNDDNFNRAQIGATRSCPEMVEQHELGEFHLCPPGDATKSIPEITKSIPKTTKSIPKQRKRQKNKCSNEMAQNQ